MNKFCMCVCTQGVGLYMYLLGCALVTVEDYERNDGTEEHPYFMSDNLKKLLNVKNKFERTDGVEATDGGGEVPGGDKMEVEPVASSEF